MLDAAVALLYVAALCAAARLAGRREGLADYVLAGRALTLPAFVLTLVPSFYGGALGIGEFTWRSGVSNWLVMGAPYYVFAMIYCVFFAGRVRLAPGLTMADHIESAYGRPLAVFCAVMIFLLASPSDELLALGALAGDVLHAPPILAAAGAGAFAAAILLGGGLRADAAVNAVQFVVMFAGFALMIPFAWARLGGPSALAAALPSSHLSLMGGMSPLRLLAWWLIAVWTIVDPVFHQRCAAAESPRTARRGVALSVACWALFDAMTTLCGLYARAALPDLQEPLLAFPRLAGAVLPAGARGFFLIALASSLLAGLQAQALQSSISLGKDAVGRCLGSGEAAQKRLVRASLVLSLALGWVFAAAIPSVVGLWYAIGSAVIPGLLWPLVGVYFPNVRATPRWALGAAVAGFTASTSWVLLQQARGAPPWGLDPMFPGLAASTAIWSAALLTAAPRAREAAAHV